MQQKKRMGKNTRVRRKSKSSASKGVNTMKYCGVIKLKEDPLAIQKRLTDEWN